jgi:hypothetical protein
MQKKNACFITASEANPSVVSANALPPIIPPAGSRNLNPLGIYSEVMAHPEAMVTFHPRNAGVSAAAMRGFVGE